MKAYLIRDGGDRRNVVLYPAFFKGFTCCRVDNALTSNVENEARITGKIRAGRNMPATQKDDVELS